MNGQSGVSRIRWLIWKALGGVLAILLGIQVWDAIHYMRQKPHRELTLRAVKLAGNGEVFSENGCITRLVRLWEKEGIPKTALPASAHSLDLLPPYGRLRDSCRQQDISASADQCDELSRGYAEILVQHAENRVTLDEYMTALVMARKWMSEHAELAGVGSLQRQECGQFIESEIRTGEFLLWTIGGYSGDYLMRLAEGETDPEERDHRNVRYMRLAESLYAVRQELPPQVRCELFLYFHELGSCYHRVLYRWKAKKFERQMEAERMSCQASS